MLSENGRFYESVYYVKFINRYPLCAVIIVRVWGNRFSGVKGGFVSALRKLRFDIAAHAAYKGGFLT
jgi:hypothetical protein